MSDFCWLIVSAALTDNIVLTMMLGLCPVVSLSKRIDTAVGVGIATMTVLTVAVIIAWPISQFLPATLARLQPLLLIALIAVIVQAATAITRLYAPLVYRHLGIFLPLIATNCAVLGVILLAVREPRTSFVHTVGLGLGGGLGFLIALVSMALLRERIIEAQVPPCFRGMPLAMITAALMTLAFSGLTGF